MQMMKERMVESAKEGMKLQASKSEIYGRMQAVFKELETTQEDVSFLVIWRLWMDVLYVGR